MILRKRSVLWLLVGMLVPLLPLPLIGWAVSSVAVFEPDVQQKNRRNLDILSIADIALIKATHAIRVDRYNIGLFGNSRALAISHEAINAKPGEFFNFAVGGTSFRQSAAMLEYLAEHDRAPKLAIISLDNHDIGFVGPVYWPPVITLPGHLQSLTTFDNLKDTWTLSQRQFQGYFNFLRIKQRIMFVTYVGMGWESHAAEYHPDGSRSEDIRTDSLKLNIHKDGVWGRYARMLEADVGRLGEVQKRGTRIVVYESPIHPQFAEIVARDRSEQLRKIREGFFAACVRASITCVPAPTLTADLPWLDCCHAPPSLLGQFIAKLIEDQK